MGWGWVGVARTLGIGWVGVNPSVGWGWVRVHLAWVEVRLG
jgi:hypothetical protein